MPLNAPDPLAAATTVIPDDALAHLAALGRPQQALNDSDLTLIFMTFGSIAQECLRRRQNMRALHALSDPDVIYLYEDAGQDPRA